MSVEIRAATDEELGAFRRIAAYAFADQQRDPEASKVPPIRPEWTTCAFVDGRMAATFLAFPFRMHLNGRRVDVAGISMVATLPEFRRRGLLRAIILQSSREQRERGQSLAILWASYAAIYQRFGYSLATTWAKYTFDPRYVGLREEGTGGGRVELLPLDEALPYMQAVYGEVAARRSLMLERIGPMWNLRLRPRDEKAPPIYLAVHRNAQGEPTGYLSYQTRPDLQLGQPAPDQVMTVGEFMASDLDAYRGLWSYLRAHDLVREVHLNNIAEDDLAPQLLLEPRQLRRRTGDGIWMRVLDVERALPQRHYGEPGELCIEIRDDRQCDWNEGRWLLETEGESARVSRTTRTADLTMSIHALAPLLAGHRSATELARAGLVEARQAAVLPRADRLFATPHRPWCCDDF
jgi:predicted acetyltransferase